MTQALYRKWRPQSWDEVVGQEHVIQTLRNAISAGWIAHAYLFTGPRGTGKTSAARLLAKAINCTEENLSKRPCGHCQCCQAATDNRFLDLIEIDAASNTSVEDVRDLRDKINFKPNQGEYKVYIIDEVHMLSTAAFNALLKTLEEPPPHAIFILATTEIHKVPATVISRCQRHEFHRILIKDIVRHLESLASKEGIQVDEETLALIARQSTGAMRDAISLLDQLASTGQKITLATAQDVLGIATSQAVLGLVDALMAKDSAAGLNVIFASLEEGSDPRQYTRQVVDYLRSLLLARMGSGSNSSSSNGFSDVPENLRKKMSEYIKAFTTSDLLRIIRLFNDAAEEKRSGWQPSLLIELAFLEALEPPVMTTSQEPRGKDVQAIPQPGGVKRERSSPIGQETAASTSTEKPVGLAASSSVTPLDSLTGSVQTPAESNPGLPEPAQPVGVSGEVSLSTNDQLYRLITERWKQVLQKMRQISPQTQGLLNSCRPYGVKDGILFLGFNGDFSKNKMEMGDNLEITCRILTEVVGRDVPVRCFVAAGGKGNLPPDVESDGMVATALRDLGGEVVDIQ